MSRILDAMYSDGITPTVELFLVSPSGVAVDFTEAWGQCAPKRTRAYRLEDDRDALTPLSLVYEYDFEFEVLPEDLEKLLEACLRRACEHPGCVAWLAFEGSFHFDHILTESVADLIYGVCATGESPLVVLDDEPAARAALRDRMRAYRRRLGLANYRK
ncbi:hypothetical protein [Microbispora bryophytorum]|uniref:Uncharacterized protein n=1 Tax=Microbispora bryophytorum subsp. camponoti TaxID=1677852 RepID=A0ABR8L965_9ACTN|nr:hypothetical protein [Microbispora camponoti]MBD3147457.1 hypothetical protein [Microbispora camponoti]